MGNVGNNSVGSYRLHAPETKQLAYATPICYLCEVARGQPSASDRPTHPSNTTVKTQIVKNAEEDDTESVIISSILTRRMRW